LTLAKDLIHLYIEDAVSRSGSLNYISSSLSSLPNPNKLKSLVIRTGVIAQNLQKLDSELADSKKYGQCAIKLYTLNSLRGLARAFGRNSLIAKIPYLTTYGCNGKVNWATADT
jgi:hypothetical protein